MGTAGHVDHGKTALIKALTNYDCDTHKEEKKRGITINLGFTHYALPSGDNIGIIDVPGHKDFIHTMLSGVFGIDFVLFLVAADSGIMPQTKEHLNILQILGMKKGIVVITKVDLVDDDILELAKEEINDLLKNTFLENAPVVEVSSVTGFGINKLKNKIFDIVNSIEKRNIDNFFRMYIDRLFTVKGFGNVATGTVINGEITKDDEVYLLPGKKNKPLKIRRIERFGNAADKVTAGDRAAINILGIDKDDFKRGMIISDSFFDETMMIDAKLQLFESASSLKLWSNVMFFSGTFETNAKIHLLTVDLLEPGNSAMVQIHFEKPCVILHNDKFVIRNSSSDRTLGGGFVVDAYPLHHRRRPEKLVASMSKLAEDSLPELIKIEVKKCLIPLKADDIAKKINKPLKEIVDVSLNNKIEDITSYKIDKTIVFIETKRDKKFYQRVVSNIRAYHNNNPIFNNGLTINEIKSKLGFSDIAIGDEYISLLLNKIADDGIIKKQNNTWMLSDFKVSLSQDIISEINMVEKFFKDYNMQVPLMSEIQPLAYKNKIKYDKLNKYIKYLVKNRTLYYIEGNYIHKSVVDRCRKKLLVFLSQNKEGINIAGFRDLVSGNRKMCLLLIGLFDKEGVTVRKGDFRFITEHGRYFLKNITFAHSNV